MKRERWQRAYRDEPQLFDDFARAEDPSGRLPRALLQEGLLSGGRVLELGCGTGRLAERLSVPFAEYVALDREPGMLGIAARRLSSRTNATTIRADAGALPFARASIDGLVAGWVIGHMPRASRTRAIAEARRVARPGSPLVLLESAETSEFQELREEAGGRRDAGLLARLASEGFEPVQEIETTIEFDSDEDAGRVLGFLCGAEALLRARPRRRFGHTVQVLRLAL